MHMGAFFIVAIRIVIPPGDGRLCIGLPLAALAARVACPSRCSGAQTTGVSDGTVIGRSIEQQRDPDRGVYGGLFDVPHRFRVGGDGPLHSRRIGHLLRRQAPAGEEDPRPDCLDLRDVTARRLFVELDVDPRTYRLIDRRPDTTPTQVEVGNLFLANRCCRRIDDYDDLLRLHGSDGENSENYGDKR